MNKLILLILIVFTVNLQAQTLGNPTHGNIYGVYESLDKEQTLTLLKNDDGSSTFVRIFSKGYVTGNFEEQENFLYVKKENESYSLKFYFETTHLIVVRPKKKPWIFTKMELLN